MPDVPAGRNADSLPTLPYQGARVRLDAVTARAQHRRNLNNSPQPTLQPGFSFA